MLLLWHFYWPVAALALLAGAVAGRFAYGPLRLRSGPDVMSRAASLRRLALAAGAATVLAFAAMWHGPFGAGERFARTLEGAATAELQRLEMRQVRATMERGPLLQRRLVLRGEADAFQRRELVRLLGAMPGVAGVRWATPPAPERR